MHHRAGRLRSILLILCLLCASISCNRTANTQVPGDEDRIQRVVHGLLPPVLIHGEPLPQWDLAERMEKSNVPGVSIAVIDQGRIAWARGFGVLEAGGTAPVTTESRFQAGSVSKPVAAMAALRLVELGTLVLDEDVNRRLVAWKVPPSDSAHGEPVTLRRLLTHSAGLGVHGFPGYTTSGSLPTLLQVLDGLPPANTAAVRVEYVPGSRFQYSGGGFCVAQQLLTEVRGKPFARVVEELVLHPVGMSHSTFDQPMAPDPRQPRAFGHDRDGVVLAGKWHRYPEQAAAGLWTTPSDLARLALEIQASWQGKSSRILSTATTREMLSPQITSEQGIGWRLAGKAQSARFEHGGDTDGYKCEVVFYLETGCGAAVMSNGDRGAGLAREILRGVAREYEWSEYLPAAKSIVSVAPEVLASYVGHYVLIIAPQVTIDVTSQAESLFVVVTQPSGTERERLFAEAPTRFFHREYDFMVTFRVDAATGRTQGLVIHQGGDEYEAKRTQ